MNKVTKILTISFLLLISVSVAASVYKYHVINDYSINIVIPCDVENEICFADSTECTVENLNETDCNYYFAYADINASEIYNCEADDGVCVKNICMTKGSTSCEVTYCSAEMLGAYNLEASCSNNYE